MTTLTDQETVVCAFCKGIGTDPYDQLSSLSKCGACDGTGKKRVATPHTTCAFCRGTGSYKTFRCLICGGAGVVPTLAARRKSVLNAKEWRARHRADSRVFVAEAEE